MVFSRLLCERGPRGSPCAPCFSFHAGNERKGVKNRVQSEQKKDLKWAVYGEREWRGRWTERERVRQSRRRREAKAQHPQTYGSLLLDYTSAGWKITSSVCVCVCVCPPAYARVCVSKSSHWSPLKITPYHLTPVCVWDAYLRWDGTMFPVDYGNARACVCVCVFYHRDYSESNRLTPPRFLEKMRGEIRSSNLRHRHCQCALDLHVFSILHPISCVLFVRVLLCTCVCVCVCVVSSGWSFLGRKQVHMLQGGRLWPHTRAPL